MTDGQVITFYSYKGGTGRTMALANVAALLSQRDAKVLVMDWDLEAPGAHRFLQPHDDSLDERPGLIELLTEAAGAGLGELDEPSTFWGPLLDRHALATTIEGVELIRAGRYSDDEYPARVNTFDWAAVHASTPTFFRDFAQATATRYDYVLIDSRTGVTDTSGICTMILPERLVVVFTPNHQSVSGAARQAEQAVRYRSRSNDLRPLMVFPLASRVELADDALRRRWRQGDSDHDLEGYQPLFERLLSSVYELGACDLTAYFDEVQVQHSTRFAYGEDVAVLHESASDRLSLARSYTSFVTVLVRAAGPWTSAGEAITRSEQLRERIRFNVPPLSEYFAGREAELAALDSSLQVSDRAVLAQAISGLGGVGKSQLAARYVHQHAHEYDIVAWIAAEDGGIKDLAALAGVLGEPVEGLTITERADRAVRWLSTCDERWLLVLDSLASAAQLPTCCPSSGNGRVVVTTRDRDIAQFAALLIVDVFDPETATSYLLERADRPKDRDGARRVADALGNLPLALAHAGAYCARGLAFDEYLELLEALPTMELFSHSPEIFYHQTVASTWQLSIEAAASQAPLAADVLAMASLLAPDDIPRGLFAALLDSDAAASRVRLIDAIAALHRFSLAVVTQEAISVHRLLQRVVRDDGAAQRELVRRAALSALARALPDDPESPEQWPAFETLVPHVLALGEALAAAGVGPDVIALLNGTCAYLLGSGGVQRAIAATLATQHAAQRLLGAEHPETLTSRANLARSYWSAGRTADAIELQERVLADSVRILGDEHPDTLTARANLGLSYWSAGRTADAIGLQERVLSDSVRVLGHEHPDTLTARANLALSYWSAGRTADAIGLQERVLSDSVRILGGEHPDTLTARANLAGSYWSAGRTADAIELEERVLAERVRILGGEHPDTLTSRANLAHSYWSVGRTADAIELQERVLAERVRILGDEHPDTLTARANLAGSYWSVARTADAIELQECVLGDSVRILGDEHPSTLTARANLANSYWSVGRTADAIELQECVLGDSVRILGDEHPSTLTARANLAGSYWSVGRTADAIELEERVLAERVRILGDEHPDTLTSRANLAHSYRLVGRTAAAIELQERVLADSVRILGDDHPHVATWREYLAVMTASTSSSRRRPA